MKLSRKTYLMSTDGACSVNARVGGWGVVVYDKQKHEFTIHGGNAIDTTNNRMELTAMLKCYQIVFEQFVKNMKECSASRASKDRYNVLSDSAYVVNPIVNGGLKKWRSYGWKLRSGDDVKNADLWEQIAEIIDMIDLLGDKGPSISLKLVKGHDGNVMNELADREAVMQKMIASCANEGSA